MTFASNQKKIDQQHIPEPDELVTLVQQLKETHTHIHPPQIAQILKVPEASLLACTINAGATRLQLEAKKILSEIPNWDSVLTVFSNESGFMMPLGVVHTIRDNGATLTLTGDHLSAEVDIDAIRDAYLLIEKDDMHGHTRSLQFFDAAGDTVIKIFILHKTKLQTVLDHCTAFTHTDQSRTYQPTLPRTSTLESVPLSEMADATTEKLKETNSKTILTKMFEHGGQFEIESVAQYSRATWTGKINKIRTDERMIHLHEADIRAHLRFKAFRQWHATVMGGISATGKDARIFRVKKL